MLEVPSTEVRSEGQFAISRSITSKSTLIEAKIEMTESAFERIIVSYPCS
jgi:hypothetical protein